MKLLHICQTRLIYFRKIELCYLVFLVIPIWLQTSHVALAQQSSLTSDANWKIASLSWSPDGTKIAVGGGTESSECGLADSSVYAIRIVDASSLSITKLLMGHTCDVISLDWNRDSSKLVSGSDDGTNRVWDTATGQLLNTTPPNTFGAKYSLSWNYDGTQYAAVDSAGRSLEIRDANTGQLLNSNTFLKEHITSVNWSPDGTKLLTGDTDGKITIWDAFSGRIISSLANQHGGEVYLVAWSPDGTLFATYGTDKAIRVWNPLNDRQLIEIQQSNTSTKLAWATNDQLISSDSMNTLRVWDAKTGLQIESFQYRGDLLAIAASPDGTRLAFGGAQKLYQSSEVTVVEIKTSTFTP
ncbi:MAG: hypothetical protein H0X30_33970 [Anaerolineae bacterium]|nr:hypothetical protein [Anaerolineae bacterium]